MHYCTGTLIAPQWVLTAKHCTDYPPEEIVPTPSKFSVIVGRQNVNRTDGEVVSVASIVPQPSEDIALLELQHAVTVPVSRLLSPARAFEVPYGSSVVIAGWGEYDSSREPPADLREATTFLMAKGADCKGLHIDPYAILGALPPNQVCLGTNPFIAGRSASIGNGDSGGPTWVQRDGQWFVAGVHSKGDGLRIYSVDVWVPDFFDWLLQNAPGQHPSFLSAAQIMAAL